MAAQWSRPSSDEQGVYQTAARGLAVLNSAVLNKGAAFPEGERAALGLTGLLPPGVATLEIQVKRAYQQYGRLPDALSKNIFLTALHEWNVTLFYRLFSEHLREMIPIVNDLTVGLAIEHYRHECRTPRGIYLSIDHMDSIERSFENLDAGAGDIDLIMATDAEQILGIGDWGLGGIEVSIGKLAIATAAGGIDPTRVIPVMLDVGTNREVLRQDPSYTGNRHARVRGARYDEFIEAYVEVATRMFPDALIQWVDFAAGNGGRILEKYRNRICTFNDDIQGTGAIVLAAAISASRACGAPLNQQRVVIFGAGVAGTGIAAKLCKAMAMEGCAAQTAASRMWCVDRGGLLTTNMSEPLKDFQVPYARPASESKGWKRGEDGIGLAEVVRRVKPTLLIGASAAEGSFTEAMIREMAENTARPAIFVLSHPGANVEATPSNLIAWTDGRGLIAMGTPFAPVTWKGTTYVIAQASNAMLYPGLALGTIVAKARRISDGMFVAAASAVSSLVNVRQPGSSLLPQIDDLRIISLQVAIAVAEAAQREGLARVKLTDIAQQVLDAMWRPEYSRIEAI